MSLAWHSVIFPRGTATRNGRRSADLPVVPEKPEPFLVWKTPKHSQTTLRRTRGRAPPVWLTERIAFSKISDKLVRTLSPRPSRFQPGRFYSRTIVQFSGHFDFSVPTSLVSFTELSNGRHLRGCYAWRSREALKEELRSRRSSALKGRAERAIVNQTNIGTVSKTTLVFTKFRCEHLSKSLLFRPEPRIISLVGKFQEELNQTLSLKMSSTTFSCRSYLLQLWQQSSPSPCPVSFRSHQLSASSLPLVSRTQLWGQFS